jgi:hypothetical protein
MQVESSHLVTVLGCDAKHGSICAFDNSVHVDTKNRGFLNNLDTIKHIVYKGILTHEA